MPAGAKTCQAIMARMNRCGRPAVYCVRGQHRCTIHTGEADRTENNRLPKVGALTLSDIHEGDIVVWKASPRGGYGYIFRVTVKVLRVHNKRVLVQPLGLRPRLVTPEHLEAMR